MIAMLDDGRARSAKLSALARRIDMSARPFSLVWLIVAVLAFLSVTPAQAQDRTVPESAAQIQLSFAPLVRAVSPAVVNIFTSRTVLARDRGPLFNDPFFQRFFGDRFQRLGPLEEETETSLGSGVIVRPDGLVVTNHHVIAEAEEIRVVLYDRSEYDASVLVSDPQTDLALLRIEGVEDRSLLALEMSDSDDLEVGDLVLAIGNPFGVGRTVTSGIVSASARTGVGISDFSFFIQTDAAINPGNSGGALVAMDGTLVGINTAIFSRDGGSVGIGFAIPSNMVRALIAGLDRGTPLARPWLGADGESLTADRAGEIGLARPAGVLITAVEPEGPADRAGIRPGDVIQAINGRPVEDAPSLRFRIATLLFEEPATMDVWRDGAVMTVELPVEPPPEDPPRNTTRLNGRNPLAGAQVANLSPALNAELGRQEGPRHGVIVLDVAQGSPADRVGLEAGDIILALNGQELTTVAEVREAVMRAASEWALSILRDGRTIDAVIRG
jgi:serine protease Do